MRKTLELNKLQNYILDICNNINRPIRKSRLISLVTDLFDCNKPKEVEFAILTLLEEGKLYKDGYFICLPEYAQSWNGKVSAMDESAVNYLFTLKETVKNDLFFSPYATENLTPANFFKYVKMHFPWVIENPSAYSYIDYLISHCPDHYLSDQIFLEASDYPYSNGWFCNFFDSKDCRILVQKMDPTFKNIFFKLILIPGRKRNYIEAHNQCLDFEEHIGQYFNNKEIIIQTIPLSMLTGNGNPTKIKNSNKQ